MTPALLDTGVIVALLDKSERHHRRCVEVVTELTGPLVTCEPVIAEACHLLRGIRGAREAVLENLRLGVFQIPFSLVELSAPVSRLIKKYEDVPADLADACMIQIAELAGTGRILTLDRDFEVYRWRSRRRFELLVELD
jgi:predicted nucleic acid-binding protein